MSTNFRFKQSSDPHRWTAIAEKKPQKDFQTQVSHILEGRYYQLSYDATSWAGGEF